MSRRRDDQIAESVAANQRARVAARRSRPLASSGLWYIAADRDRGHHGLPVLLDAVDVAQGPARPDHVGAAAVHPERPDPGELREGAGQRCRSRASSSTAWSSRSRSGLLNVLVAALAAYPLAKMRFPGRDAIFYLLLATLIVPAQLTYIPSFVLAVNVFHYYDTLPALIFPNLVSAFNIFLLRQAFRGVPQRPHRRGPGRRRRGVADLVVDPACRSSGRRSPRSRSSRSSRRGTTSCGRR